MPSVAVEKLLMLQEGMTQSVDDPFPILLDNLKDPEGFQPHLFSNQSMSYDQRDDIYLPSSFFRQGPETR
jgi:hypothetical protein